MPRSFWPLSVAIRPDRRVGSTSSMEFPACVLYVAINAPFFSEGQGTDRQTDDGLIAALLNAAYVRQLQTRIAILIRNT